MLEGFKRARGAVCQGLAGLALGGSVAMQAIAGGIPCGYEITHVIEAPPCVGGNSLTPTAISSDGRYVAAYYGVCFSGDSKAAVFDRVAGQLITIPLPGGFSDSKAWGVNIMGQVCGTANKNGVGQRGFVFDLGTGVWTEIPSQDRETGWSHADAINDSGVVCGYRSLDDGGDPVNPWNAYVWSPESGFIDLGVMTGVRSEARDISNTGYVCGWTGSTGLNARGFVWHQGELQILPEIPKGTTSFAHAVNDDGQVFGSGRILVNGLVITKPFRWQNRDFTILPTLPDLERGGIADVNSQELLIGMCSDAQDTDTMTICLWSNDSPFDLSEFAPMPNNVILWDGGVIADNGDLVVRGRNKTAFVGLVLAPTRAPMGDINCDQIVDVDDLLTVINNWGSCLDCSADLNEDRTVDSTDLGIVIKHWTH